MASAELLARSTLSHAEGGVPINIRLGGPVCINCWACETKLCTRMAGKLACTGCLRLPAAYTAGIVTELHRQGCRRTW